MKKLERGIVSSGLVVWIVLAFGLAQPAGAATFTVTDIGNSGAGTPRDAIGDANGLMCTDIIDFDLTGCSCKLTLSS